MRGPWHPCHRKADQRKWKGENTGTPAIHPCESALIRGSAQRLPGEFHPSPPSSLPFQGRGVPCALSSARTNTKCSPRPRNGGEGSGVRGQATQESPLQPADKSTRGCGANPRPPLWPLVLSVVQKTRLTRGLAGQISGWKARATGRAAAGGCTPHPRPLSPSRGEGCQCDLHCNKNTKSSPRPQRGRGVGGEGAGSLQKHHAAFHSRLRGFGFIRENPCSSVAKNTPHPWRNTPIRGQNSRLPPNPVQRRIHVRLRPGDQLRNQLPGPRAHRDPQHAVTSRNPHVAESR